MSVTLLNLGGDRTTTLGLKHIANGSEVPLKGDMVMDDPVFLFLDGLKRGCSLCSFVR